MPASAAVRAILDQAAAIASGHPGVRAVVILLVAPGSVTVVGEPADRAALPWPLRRELELATRGESATLCPGCAGHGEPR